MSAPAFAIETERLRLSELSANSDADADFLLELMNTADFIRHINDRGIRSRDDARRHIRERNLPMYAQHGHGLWKVALKDGTAVGTCGLVRREGLDVPDLGYAFLPAHYGCGYAREAARATLGFARETLRIPRVLAIVNPDNAASIRLLQDLRFGSGKMLALPGIDHEVQLFSLELN